MCHREKKCPYGAVNDRVWDRFCDSRHRNPPVTGIVVTKVLMYFCLLFVFHQHVHALQLDGPKVICVHVIDQIPLYEPPSFTTDFLVFLEVV